MLSLRAQRLRGEKLLDTVNLPVPGSTRTAQTERRLEGAADPAAVIAPLVVHQAMKRLAIPEEIGWTATLDRRPSALERHLISARGS